VGCPPKPPESVRISEGNRPTHLHWRESQGREARNSAGQVDGNCISKKERNNICINLLICLEATSRASHFLAKKTRKKRFPLKKIVYVPDDLANLANSVSYAPF